MFGGLWVYGNVEKYLKKSLVVSKIIRNFVSDLRKKPITNKLNYTTMTKEDVIKKLQNSRCKYAVVVTDVHSTGNNSIVWGKDRIIVSVLEMQNPAKFFGNSYCVCNSIRDFRENCVFGLAEAKKHFCRYYFGEIYDVIENY